IHDDAGRRIRSYSSADRTTTTGFPPRVIVTLSPASAFRISANHCFRASSIETIAPPDLTTRTISERRLHPEHAELRRLDRRIERGRERQAQDAPRLRRVDHAV